LLYEIPALKHIDPQTTAEAVFWLQEYGPRARISAGGTDLLGLLKDRIEAAEVLINVKDIAEMKRLAFQEKKGFRIGAAVTLNQLESSDIIRTKFPILAAAARQVGTTQIRNMGTIGGNILQRPQCVYFRNPDFPCRKKGQTRCYAAAGEHRDHCAVLEYGKCVIAHPSDMAPALIALNASAVIAGKDGMREVPLEDFFLGGNYARETVLGFDELLLGFTVPDGVRGSQIFLKSRIRHSFDFALVSVAVAAQVKDGICHDLRIVLGGVAPFPYLDRYVSEMIRGKKIDRDIALQAGQESLKKARPLPGNGYKVEAAKNLVARAVLSISEDTLTPDKT
jgi:xanthine dehydrogenase YagS FAD-binding subunit